MAVSRLSLSRQEMGKWDALAGGHGIILLLMQQTNFQVICGFSMSENTPKRPSALQFIHDLKQDASMERQEIAPAGLPSALQELRTWQTQRLTCTYQDFLEDPRYGNACRFFLDDVYAPRDFSQRDHDIEHFYQLMLRFVPEQMLALVREAIELNRFSNQLDLRLLNALDEAGVAPAALTPQSYARAYRICANYPDRVEQIDRLVRVLEEVAAGARNPLVLVTLKLAHGPASMAGWGDLQDFLVRGCQAFRQMKGGLKFIQAVQQREMRILNRLFDDHSDPFGIE